MRTKASVHSVELTCRRTDLGFLFPAYILMRKWHSGLHIIWQVEERFRGVENGFDLVDADFGVGQGKETVGLSCMDKLCRDLVDMVGKIGQRNARDAALRILRSGGHICDIEF